MLRSVLLLAENNATGDKCPHLNQSTNSNNNFENDRILSYRKLMALQLRQGYRQYLWPNVRNTSIT